MTLDLRVSLCDSGSVTRDLTRVTAPWDSRLDSRLGLCDSGLDSGLDPSDSATALGIKFIFIKK